MVPSGSPQPPNLLGGFKDLKDLPNPGLIGYFLQVLERIYNEVLAGKTQNVEDVLVPSFTSQARINHFMFSSRLNSINLKVTGAPPDAWCSNWRLKWLHVFKLIFKAHCAELIVSRTSASPERPGRTCCCKDPGLNRQTAVEAKQIAEIDIDRRSAMNPIWVSPNHPTSLGDCCPTKALTLDVAMQ